MCGIFFVFIEFELSIHFGMQTCDDDDYDEPQSQASINDPAARTIHSPWSTFSTITIIIIRTISTPR